MRRTVILGVKDRFFSDEILFLGGYVSGKDKDFPFDEKRKIFCRMRSIFSL